MRGEKHGHNIYVERVYSFQVSRLNRNIINYVPCTTTIEHGIFTVVTAIASRTGLIQKREFSVKATDKTQS